MKVISASHMTELESAAYQIGCSETDFMEQAGIGISRVVNSYIDTHGYARRVLLLCGKGNNTGDGFVACSYLLELGYQVWALHYDPIENCSTLCRLNRKRFELKGGIFLQNFLDCPSPGLILDGIFGTGFKGVVKAPYAQMIQEANQSKIPILAIDIPSGLDGSTGKIRSCAIQATQTIFLGLPKKGFFFNEGWNAVGKLERVDFGLPAAILHQVQSNYCLLTEEEVSGYLPTIKRNRNKYQAGYVTGLAGSPSMPGAALLSSMAALRAGSGMVKLLHPSGMESLLAHSPYELIKLPYEETDSQQVLEEMNKAGSTFIGPGLGRTQEVARLLKNVIPYLEKPCVLDADALTLLAENAFNFPLQAVITPHFGEMQRLLQSEARLELNEELMTTCQKYVDRHQITLVLKGAPSFIFHPDSSIFICPTGDPGMATAGSGDVLTGLIASLLSQGAPCREAAALGTFLHGLAGEYAAGYLTSFTLIASDLIANLSNAYKLLINK